MNILLFQSNDILAQLDQHVFKIKIQGERFTHISQKQNFQVGDTLRVGQVNGLKGEGTIESLSSKQATIIAKLSLEPPPAAQGKLILALPRPIMLKRLFVDIAMLGIKDIVLLHSQHVQKSYWTSKIFANEEINQFFLRGLEQSCDTVLPKLSYAKRFKPFVEDQLQAFSNFGNTPSQIILAHPNSQQTCPQPAQGAFTLIVGPEKGFTEYEVDLLTANGATAYTLGERHLRVETAATFLLGRLL